MKGNLSIKTTWPLLATAVSGEETDVTHHSCSGARVWKTQPEDTTLNFFIVPSVTANKPFNNLVYLKLSSRLLNTYFRFLRLTVTRAIIFARK